MTLPLSFPVIFLIAVVAQAVFAAALLAAAPANRLPNRLLALLLLAVALWELDAFGRVSELYRQNPELYFSPIYYSLGFGPLVWWYVRALTNEGFRWEWRRETWHLVPVMLQALLYWWLRFQPYQTRLWFWQAIHQPYTYRVEFVGTWVSLVIYLGLSLKLLQRYARWLPENFSELSALRLRWLRVVLWLLAAVSGQWLVEVVLREGFGRYYAYDYSTWLLGGALLLLGAGGLRQADMRAVHFVESDVEPKPLETPEPPPITAASATRTYDPAVLAQLREALETERLFLNPTLTLAELAAHTGLAPRLISMTINAGYGRPFADVVNGLRVAEVQRLLAEPTTLTRLSLLGVALESGFNSKTTFNRVFKELTGVAPSEWKPAQ
jgi:AraC-like DNA-binding protein